MHHKINYLLILIIILVSGITGLFAWHNNLPLVSPIALIEGMTGNSIATRSPKIIYGFFPYWNSKYSDQLNISFLTHFAYFAIDLNPDGTVYKINTNKEQEPGWNKLKSKTTEKLLFQAKLLHQKTVLTVTAMDPELIESIFDSQIVTDTTINSVINVYKDFNFDDINIDFEYVGEPTPKARLGFVNFIRKLKDTCLDTNKNCHIDIDIFADSASKARLWDLQALSQTVDRFIVMSYDYYRKTSTQAGPVAPITGKCNNDGTSTCLDQDIISHISQITKIIPSQKIILGIPFYGYEWQTASEDFLANTYPKTGSMASYSRIQSLFNDPKISSMSAKWSDTTLSPYLVFYKDNELHQIHYENQDSLLQKIKLVKSANLGGIAIWALGYETPYLELWDPIKSLSTH